MVKCVFMSFKKSFINALVKVLLMLDLYFFVTCKFWYHIALNKMSQTNEVVVMWN